MSPSKSDRSLSSVATRVDTWLCATLRATVFVGCARRRIGETCFFDVLAIIKHFTAKFVSGGGVIDVGGSVVSTLAAALAKISCVERCSTCFVSAGLAVVTVTGTKINDMLETATF
jgi:hypothetical protein